MKLLWKGTNKIFKIKSLFKKLEQRDSCNQYGEDIKR